MPRECHACYGFQCRSLVFRLRQPGRPGLLQPASLLCVHAGPAIFGWGFSEFGYVYVCLCVFFHVCVIQLCSRRSLSAQLAQQTAHCVLLSAVQPLSTLWKRTIGTKNIEKYSIGEWKIKNVQKHRRL